MHHDVLLAIWVMLPAAAANATPIAAAKLPFLKRWDAPIDGGQKWRGKALLGPHKTWRGLLSGTMVGGLVFVLQLLILDKVHWQSGHALYDSLSIFFGFSIGFGALAGDAVESFFKRQRGVASGKSWMPFDQIDYIVGAIIVSLFFVVFAWQVYLWILIIWFVMHLVASYIGWLLKLKDAPI